MPGMTDRSALAAHDRLVDAGAAGQMRPCSRSADLRLPEQRAAHVRRPAERQVSAGR